MNTKWDLEQLFTKENLPDYTRKKRESWNTFAKRYRRDKTYLSSPIALKKALDEYCDLSKNYGINGLDNFYYRLASDLDLTNTKIHKEDKILDDISIKLSNEVEFFFLDLGKVAKSVQKKFLTSKILHNYHYFLKKHFVLARYFLSEEAEKVANLLSGSSRANWIRMTEELISSEKIQIIDSSNKKKTISFEELLTLINDEDYKVRKNAADKFNDILEKYKKVAEYEINSVLDSKRALDEIRGFGYPEESNYIGNDISPKVVDALVANVKDSYGVSSRYYHLKSRLLGKRRLEYFERNVRLGNVIKEYSFDEAKTLVGKVFYNLDEEFGELFEDYFRTSRVDVYPKIGKTHGAYCSTNSISSPSFVLLNYTGKIGDVTTLAHEFGHVLNMEYMKAVRNPLYYDISSILLEVPSNFFENFVCDEISKQLSAEDQLFLNMERLNSAISTVHRQTACFLFEKDLHSSFLKNRYLSAEEVGELFHKNMKSYMGEYVTYPDYSHNWWIYWSHIRNFFYVYSYASGDLISRFMQKKVKDNHSWVKNFKEFLKQGESKSPKDVLKMIDVDICSDDVWKDGLSEIDKLLSDTENMAKSLGKI